MVKHRYERIGETLYEETLENGLRVFVFPKPDFGKCYAFFATRYGGMDTRFQLNGQWVDTPMGIAHYLEHKMFDTPDGGNALQALSATGASPSSGRTSRPCWNLSPCRTSPRKAWKKSRASLARRSA